MNQMSVQPHGLIGALVPVLIVALVLFIRFRRMGKARPLRLERLWLLPVIYGAFATLMLAAIPPQGRNWSWIALALAVGAGAGWMRGKTMHISVDPETHALDHMQSPAALVFLLVLLLVRTGSRMYLQSAGGGLSHQGAMLLTAVLLAFAMGMLTLQRLAMCLRAKRLLAEVRGGR